MTDNIKVKFCGLTDATAINAANALRVDMVGFVFFKKSPRHLDDIKAAQLAAQLDPAIERVALLVDPDDDMLENVMRSVSPHRIQLHGHESPARLTEIRRQTLCPLIKAGGVSGPEDLDAMERYADTADMYLLDAKPPANADMPGGNGVVFDWSLLAGRRLSRPWMLSGGLTPENVTAAIDASGAAMVDVSSGIETTSGQKDPALMRKFIANVRPEVR